MKHYDFAVIGAGVIGAWVAFELSKYDVSVCVLEKENDCAMGTSKANSAIVHAGYDPEPGTLMARLNVRGNELIRRYAKQMSIPFRRIGSLVAALNDEGLNVIKALYERGLANGVPDLRILNAEETKIIEPKISDECKGALYAPTAGVCSPFDLTVAPLEISVVNGVAFERNYEVTKIIRRKSGFVINDETEAGCIINCAGLYSDEIASLLGDDSIGITARKGEYSILDKNTADIVHHVIFQPPTSLGKGILVSPTVDGNILVGPNAYDVDSKDDLSTTREGQDEIFAGAAAVVPAVERRSVITSFAGQRAISDKSGFIIGFSDSVPGLLNVAGICSPGLTSAPAIGEYVAGLLKEKGLLQKKKNQYSESRDVIRLHEMSIEDSKKLISENPLYGRVVCRCETVTEGEIIDSIRRPAGAFDVDGVKRRTRAGMGRCQGGFCAPKVMAILARELQIPITDVTKFGRKSHMVSKKGWDQYDS